MSIEKIKNFISDNMNMTIKFRYNGSRNQIEEFTGEIVSVYKYIFLIKVDGMPFTKSFSYTDVLIKNLELILQ